MKTNQNTGSKGRESMEYYCECPICFVKMYRQATYDNRDIWQCRGCGKRSVVIRVY